MASAMDLSQAVAAGVSAGLQGGRKRPRSGSIKSTGSKKGKRASGSSRALSRSVAWHGRPLPPVLTTRLRYCTSAISGTAAGGQYEYLINTQDLYDPDRTSAGHQPMGFDELAGLYDSYRVHACHYKVTFVTTDNTGYLLSSATLWANDVTTAAATIQEAQEQAGSVTKYANFVSLPTSISRTFYPWETIGQTKQQYMSDNNNRALCTTSPSNQNIIHFQFGSGAASFAYNFFIELEYECQFLDPKRTNQS